MGQKYSIIERLEGDTEKRRNNIKHAITIQKLKNHRQKTEAQSATADQQIERHGGYFIFLELFALTKRG